MEICTRVSEFVALCEQPALLDLGEEPFALRPDCWSVTDWNGRAVLQAWADYRNLVRRVTAVKEQRRVRIVLATERFPKVVGEMQICDMAAPAGRELERRSSKTAFRERFRLMLAREFPAWTLVDLSSEPNLEQSLSPSYVRAFLRNGSMGIAAMAAPPGCAEPAGVVAFGLIWLDYLRRREPSMTIRTLVYFAEESAIRSVQSRTRWIRSNSVGCSIYFFDERERFAKAEDWSEGNIGAPLPACRRPELPNLDLPAIPSMPGVECIEQSDGSLRFQVFGLEFARWSAGKFQCGIGRKRRCDSREVVALARELLRVRSADAEDRQHPLFKQAPEGWMESQLRAEPQAVEATLLTQPLYGQVPFTAGLERGVVDLLGVDTDGRLAILELKAAAEIQLPFQALDYLSKVRRHLEAGDFERQGYFQGIRLSRQLPRIFLIAPALEFHSTSEIVLSYLDPEVEFIRIGLASDWRRNLRVMFRLRGAERPT